MALTCAQFVDLVTDYLEGVLDRRTVVHVAQHLKDCDGCTAYLKQIQSSRRIGRSLADRDKQPELDEEALHAAYRLLSGRPEDD